MKVLVEIGNVYLILENAFYMTFVRGVFYTKKEAKKHIKIISKNETVPIQNFVVKEWKIGECI